MSWWSTAFTRLIFWVDWAPIRSGPAASPLPVGEHRRHLAIQRRDRTPGADCPVELACGLGAVEARPRGERRRCREYEKQCRCHDWIPGHVCRSEEHTSELQSLMRISYAVFCLKKKPKLKDITVYTRNHAHKRINI